MIQKKVEFYKIIYSFYPMSTIKYSEEQLKDFLISEILKSLDNMRNNIIEVEKTENSSVIIEILQYNNDYLFGIIGKLEDLEGGLLKRLRSKKDLKEKEDENPKYYLENFTYFFVRFIDFKCAVLGNNAAPRFKTHFTNFLNKTIEKLLSHDTHPIILQNLNVVNIFDDTIDYKINQTQKISEINMIFEDDSEIARNIIDLSNSFYISQSDLRRAKIYLHLKMSSVTEKTKEILKNSELINSNFEKFEIIGEDVDSKEIQIELVEKLLMKKVNIEIDEKYLRTSEDLDKIKEALSESLPPTLTFQKNN